VKPCTHSLTIDFQEWSSEEGWVYHRSCVLCGVTYDRQAFLRKLERRIRDRWSLGKSPWKASERNEQGGHGLGVW